MIHPGRLEELDYHWKRFFRDDRDPETWTNRNDRLILNTYYAEANLDFNMFDGSVILDIGGGPSSGLYHEPFNNAVLRVIIDPLAWDFQQMIRNDYVHYQNRKDVIEIAGVAEAIPFADESFDYVVNFNSLDHWDDWKKGTREIRRVMRIGASMFFFVNWGRPCPTPGHPVDFNEETLGWMLEQGFSLRYRNLAWRQRPARKVQSPYTLMEAI